MAADPDSTLLAHLADRSALEDTDSHSLVRRALRLIECGDLRGAMDDFADAGATGRPFLNELLRVSGRWDEIPGVDGAGSQEPFVPRGFSDAPPEECTWTDSVGLLALSPRGTSAPAVSVSVNGVASEARVDTGAELSVISAPLAHRLGIQPIGQGKEIPGTGTDARVRLCPALVEEFRVGPLLLRYHPILISDGRDHPGVATRLPGSRTGIVVGWPVLARTNAEFDLSVARLTVRPPTVGSAERNLHWLGQPLVRAVGARGEDLLFRFDTGARDTSVTRRFLHVTGTDVSGSAAATPSRTQRRWGGADMVESVRIGVGDRDIVLRHVPLKPDARDTLVQIDGVLGFGIAALGKIVVDGGAGIFRVVP